MSPRQYGLTIQNTFVSDVEDGINRSYNTQQLDNVISGTILTDRRRTGNTAPVTLEDIASWRFLNLKTSYKNAKRKAGVDVYYDNLTVISGNADLVIYEVLYDTITGTGLTYDTEVYSEADPFQYIAIDFAGGKIVESISFTTSSGWYWNSKYWIAYYIAYTTYDDPATWKLVSDDSTNVVDWYNGSVQQTPIETVDWYDMGTAWENSFWHRSDDFTRTITFTFDKPKNVRMIRVYLGDLYPIYYTIAGGIEDYAYYDGTLNELTYSTY